MDFQLEKDYKDVLSCRQCFILKPPPAYGLICTACQLEMESDWPELVALIDEYPDKDIAELEIMAVKGKLK